VDELRDFKFGVPVGQLIIASSSLWTTSCPWKGRGHIMWPISNFGK